MVERMHLANESAGLSVWEWDIRSDIARVADGSAFIERLGGLNEFKGSEYAQSFVHPDEREEWTQIFTRAVMGRDDVFSHRYRIVYPNGSIGHIQFHGRILRDARRHPVSVLGIDWDVTHEEKAKEEIEDLRLAIK